MAPVARDAAGTYFRTGVRRKVATVHRAGCPVLERVREAYRWEAMEGMDPEELAEFVKTLAPWHRLCRYCFGDAKGTCPGDSR